MKLSILPNIDPGSFIPKTVNRLFVYTTVCNLLSKWTFSWNWQSSFLSVYIRLFSTYKCVFLENYYYIWGWWCVILGDCRIEEERAMNWPCFYPKPDSLFKDRVWTCTEYIEAKPNMTKYGSTQFLFHLFTTVSTRPLLFIYKRSNPGIYHTFFFKKKFTCLPQRFNFLRIFC